ncbi:hypothetical protein CIRMBP1230_00418 [Enterococcus cecorum]|uniref:phage tail assembly chaperone G n=1 Tax=Enterococcus cecorum TaxID=44008 RepID=UPI000B07A154|nr:hypothetical protein [Enterococcus cecorum]CAI3254685.1 hypothetical protein CIRMBP1223_00064 [Enterococcus cecorum]CAI3255935.1 hypothetical protein CIRMBP1239_00064 [Enterococcus cecorum]CAI3260772.1 hypothetical protein CIRMBP1252_00158 [Enterococcus cecorum]CAI3263700.1 hypothetical protein CIRMBP1260_00159 [Enterococcus cecorum]CAI3264067.1 hypothetical protein CIRMBP1206_00155 [Enterococcus cecorum]
MAIKLKLRNKKGEFKTYYQEFVPYRKRLDYLKEEAEITDEYEKFVQQLPVDNNGKPIIPTAEYTDYELKLANFRAEFVANLFDDKAVTKDAILDGMEPSDATDEIMNIIMYDVLGYKKEDEDEEAPK